MKTKIILTLGIIVAVGIGVMFIFFGNDDESKSVENSSGFFVRENAIYVAEQSPSNTVSVSIVRLEKPGFAVVHEDINEMPGGILGISNLIASGETADSLLITLFRPTLDGEMIYVMLHFDNGDGIFDVAKDKPVIDPITNEPVMMIVVISQDATEPDTVSPY
jgi:hypothetical protein